MIQKFFAVLFSAGGILLFAGCATVSPDIPESFAAQEWRADGTLKLTCGDYTIITGKRFNGKVAGLAFQGKELFVKAGSTQLGTLYEAPFPKDKNAEYAVIVDGKVPEFVNGDISGKQRIELLRRSDYGDLRIFARYILTPDGLSWSVRYKIVDEKHKARYFYLFTLPWSNKFTEYLYWKGKEHKSGKMLNKKAWLICDDLDSLLLYAPELNVWAVTEIVGKIPTESRRHTLWDLPNFHKYFLFHALPEWKAGYESPTYTVRIKVYNADKNGFIKKQL